MLFIRSIDLFVRLWIGVNKRPKQHTFDIPRARQWNPIPCHRPPMWNDKISDCRCNIATSEKSLLNVFDCGTPPITSTYLHTTRAFGINCKVFGKHSWPNDDQISERNWKVQQKAINIKFRSGNVYRQTVPSGTQWSDHQHNVMETTLPLLLVRFICIPVHKHNHLNRLPNNQMEKLTVVYFRKLNVI